MPNTTRPLLSLLLTLLLYPLFTRWGGANEPLASIFPFMPLEMGNGIITWLIITAIIGGIAFAVWYRKQGVPLQYLGVLASPARAQSATVIRRHLLLALLLAAYLYALTLLIHNLFAQELRFLWPLLKPMTAERCGKYLQGDRNALSIIED